MSYPSQTTMQTESTTSINNMRTAILMDVSKSVNNTLAPFMEKVRVAEERNNAIQEMLQHHPIYLQLVEENIMLKKQLRINSDSGNVKMDIHESKSNSQVSVSDIYNEFGLVKKENTNLNQKKTVVTSLPDGGSAISSKLVDFQKSLEETLVDNHELLDEFKTTFSDFLQNVTDSESETSSVEEIDPPKLTRQTIDLTGSWLSNTTVKQETTNLNDPIQARLALGSPSSSKNEVKVKVENESKSSAPSEEYVYDDEEEDDEDEDDEEDDDDEDDDEEDDDDEDDEEDEDEDEEEEVEEDEDEDDEEEVDEEEEDENEESDEEEKIPDKARTVPSQEDSNNDDESEEEELYMMELEDDDGNPLEYYCNDEEEMNGDLFEILPDESVGPKIGIIKDGEIELFE